MSMDKASPLINIWIIDLLCKKKIYYEDDILTKTVSLSCFTLVY